MSSKWQEAYGRLRDFIAANPGISIDTNITVILGDVRPEFYRLFDEVRGAFVEEKCLDLLQKARSLSENYVKAEHEVMEILKLDSVSIIEPLNRFIHDPVNAMIRELWDSLFNLLKGKIDPELFERQGLRNIEVSFGGLMRHGYAKWVALSLVKMLEPDQIMDNVPPESDVDGHGDPRFHETPIPVPAETRILRFDFGPHIYPPFITPNFIVHSARLNRYVSFRSELWAKAEYSALNASEKREWIPVDSIDKEEFLAAQHDPSLFIYIGDTAEEVCMLIDKTRICRPDLIVESNEPEDWVDLEKLARRTRLFDILNPRLGRYRVTREAVDERAFEKLRLTRSSNDRVKAEHLSQENVATAEKQVPEKQNIVIPLITVGFDQSKLEPVVGTINSFDSQDLTKRDEVSKDG